VAPVAPPASSSASPAEPVPSSAANTFLGRSLLGGPVRWDPCETVTYALDLRQAPAYAAADAAEANVDDAGEIMYDGLQPTLTMSDWGQGDLEGLGRLGRTDECS
jgi:hypothetical protein